MKDLLLVSGTAPESSKQVLTRKQKEDIVRARYGSLRIFNKVKLTEYEVAAKLNIARSTVHYTLAKFKQASFRFDGLGHHRTQFAVLEPAV